MSVHDTAPPREPAPASCPRWCYGDHSGDQHRAELGRVSSDGSELALIVAIVQPVDGRPAVELSWKAADPGDTAHYFMEEIVLYSDEVPDVAELLAHARRMLGEAA